MNVIECEAPEQCAADDDAELPRKPLSMAEYGLTEAALDAVMAHAEAIAQAKAKPARVSLADKWRTAGLQREMPELNSDANASYMKRAAALLGSALAGDIKSLTTEVTGTNTYAKALRAYQAGLIDSCGIAK